MGACSSVKGDLKWAFVNVRIRSWLIFLFPSSLESELFSAPFQKGILEWLKRPLASHPIHSFSRRTEFGITSVYLHPICDFFFDFLEQTQPPEISPVSPLRQLLHGAASEYARCWFDARCSGAPIRRDSGRQWQTSRADMCRQEAADLLLTSVLFTEM